MNELQDLTELLTRQWRQIRKLTYDYLDMLSPADLDRVLPFPTSRSIGYQFWCMVGAQESYLNKLEHGSWQGFASSLDQFQDVTPAIIRQQMEAADERMLGLLRSLNLVEKLDNGESRVDVVFQIIKHEMHHHGQLINLMYCHKLPIPVSWADEWALAYEE